MSDTLRLHRAIRAALDQLYPTKPAGRLAQYLETLAWLITGIVKSGKSQLPALASHIPSARRESRVKRLSRFTQNERIGEAGAPVSLPHYARSLLLGLARTRKRLSLVIDGSDVGDGCRALVVSVVYGSRALPLALHVEAGAKGHFGEAAHLALLGQVRALLPEGVTVTLLGDGEFDGTGLLERAEAWGWTYVCRSAANARLEADGEEFAFREITPLPGDTFSVPGTLFTRRRYGPLLAVAAWGAGCREPLYLVSNLELAEEALHLYRERFRIETFFSDQKSRGFRLHQSHLSDPDRLSRLMIACCLAYWWVVFLGKRASQPEWRGVLHRKSRCDLSLFQLGLILLQHLLNLSLPIPACFLSPPHCPLKCVRY